MQSIWSTCHLCSKPNHFASVRHFKNKPACGKTEHRGHNGLKQVTEETETSDDEMTDRDNPLFKIEEVSSMKTPGKHFNAQITFSGSEELYNTELECQLDTAGATCNMTSLCGLAIIN